MSKIYFGDGDGVAQHPQKIYIGDENGTARLVKKAYVGDTDGLAHQVWPYTLLPRAYQQVEYIFNTGHTQYIDVGVKPNSDTRMELTFKVVRKYGTSGSQDMLSVVSNSGKYANVIDMTLNAWEIKFEFGGSSSSYIQFDTYQSEVQHVLDFNRSGGKFYIDDVLKYSSTTTFSDINANISVFGRSTPDAITASNVEYNVYRFKVWKNNTLMRDMYPCYLKSDSQVVGMYDVAGGAFYGNDGTGIFYKGPDVV